MASSITGLIREFKFTSGYLVTKSLGDHHNRIPVGRGFTNENRFGGGLLAKARVTGTGFILQPQTTEKKNGENTVLRHRALGSQDSNS